MTEMIASVLPPLRMKGTIEREKKRAHLLCHEALRSLSKLDPSVDDFKSLIFASFFSMFTSPLGS